MNGQRDEGQEVVETTQSLQVGDVLDVTVQDQPAAGYRWETATLPAGLTRLADTAPGEVVGGRGAAAGAVGGSVARVLHLRAERLGSFEVVLRLLRPWETGTVAPAGERRLTVVVAGHPSDDTGSPGGRGTPEAGWAPAMTDTAPTPDVEPPTPTPDPLPPGTPDPAPTDPADPAPQSPHPMPSPEPQPDPQL